MWPPVRAKLTGDAAGLALMDEMEDDHDLIDPLLDAIGDTLAADAGDERLRARCKHSRDTTRSNADQSARCIGMT